MKTLDTLQLASSLSIFCKQCQCDFLEDSFVFILDWPHWMLRQKFVKKRFFSTSALARTYMLLVGWTLTRSWSCSCSWCSWCSCSSSACWMTKSRSICTTWQLWQVCHNLKDKKVENILKVIVAVGMLKGNHPNQIWQRQRIPLIDDICRVLKHLTRKLVIGSFNGSSI